MPPLEPFPIHSSVEPSDEICVEGEIKSLIYKKKLDEGIFLKDTVPSITEIKKNIPAKYFSPSIKTSFKYVAWDLMIVAIVFATYLTLDSIGSIPSIVKIFVILPSYAFIQGTMFWAIFVLGHDCGHGSFSRYPWLNDVVGTFLHTLILVPYTPWKLSHRHHHKNTGNIDKDEVFFPLRESEAFSMTKGVKSTKLIPYFGFGIGWIIYLIVGYGTRATSHVNPYDPLFAKNRAGAITSVTCVLLALFVLCNASIHFGILAVVKYYFLPWIIFASWLVITTFLHHHGSEENIKLPWFSNDQWNYVVGNLSSVDRDYGTLHDVTHSIGTHQVHHLFPAIPHYYLKEATTSFRKRYPQFKRESNKPIIKSFIDTFTVWKRQFIISDDTKVFVYTNENEGKKQK
ncbi:25270_t:CDS:1 [Dentiscutata erythropus]|uniref:25270_t:CDS:1 n=1 Tax=Dentiscutata erythropus TaxID=1348616 RepID=A0A9N9BB30_9GLOM|nr:25270_t:CDS:1 [Dentiscutata erythropus]